MLEWTSAKQQWPKVEGVNEENQYFLVIKVCIEETRLGMWIGSVCRTDDQSGGRIMDKIDDNMDQFLRDLHTMKGELIRVKGAATSTASLKSSDMEDIQQKIDVLLARLLPG